MVRSLAMAPMKGWTSLKIAVRCENSYGGDYKRTEWEVVHHGRSRQEERHQHFSGLNRRCYHIVTLLQIIPVREGHNKSSLETAWLSMAVRYKED